MATQQKAARRTALITGASAGIGLAFANLLAEQGFDLVLTARRQEQLRQIATKLEKQFGIRTWVIPGDLADLNAPQLIFDATQTHGLAIDMLVNNAGYGLRGSFANTAWQDQAKFIQVMATAVGHLCHLFLPGMVARGYGRIINVASVSGIVPGSPGMTLYGATKSFVIQLSETLHLEYQKNGVHVCASCPGFTHTDFQRNAQIDHITDRRVPKMLWMETDAVARGSIEAVMRGKPRYIPGAVNKLGVILAEKIVPRRVALWAAKAQMKDLLNHTERAIAP